METSNKREKFVKKSNPRPSEEGPRGMGKTRFYLIAVASIALITTLTYYNSFEVSFHFDDEPVILKNPNIRDLSDLKSVLTHNLSRSILFLTFAINHHFSQLDPWGYHVGNLLLHLLNSLLVYFFVLFILAKSPGLFTRARVIALLTSLIYASSPVLTESVTYIASRSSVLCTTFYLLAILFFTKARGRDGQGAFIFYFLFSILSFLLALGTKELAATLPAILLLYDYTFLSRHTQRRWWERIIRYHLPFLIVLAAYFIWRHYLYGSVGRAVYPHSISSYLLTESHVIFNYIKLLFFPFNLNVDPDFPISTSLFEPSIFISIVVLIGVLTGALIFFKDYREISFGIFWFFITISPTSSIVPLEDVMAEHRVYLPAVGFSLILGRILERISTLKIKRFPPRRWEVGSLLVFLLVFLSFSSTTIRRNVAWKNKITLWGDTIKKSPRKGRPHNNLGNAFKEKGLIDQAIREYKVGMRVEPTYELTYNNLGATYLEMGKIDEAIEQYRKALRVNPNFSEAHFNLAVAYERKGLTEEAEVEYAKASRLKPNSTYAKVKLGKSLLKKGEAEQAFKEFLEAVKIDPNYEPAQANLAHAYHKKRQYQEAIAHYRAAIRLNPKSAETRLNLGTAFFEQKIYKEAIKEFEEALKIKSGYALAHTNLGAIYSKNVIDRDKALYHFRETLRLDPNQSQAKAIKESIKSLLSGK